MIFKEKLAELFALIKNNKLLNTIKIPPEKRRFVIITTAGILAILLLLITGISLLTRGQSRGQNILTDENPVVRHGIIPPEDLFLPEEPDFLPGVILEREQRSVWTAENVEPWWQDPLRSGEERWRYQIEKTIDELMENVP